MAIFLRDCKGIIFDMDGTLTIPTLDFKAMREQARIPIGQDILHALDAMNPDDRAHAEGVIASMELEAAKKTQLQPGLVELLQYLDDHAQLPRFKHFMECS